MCLAIFKPKGVTIKKKYLRNGWDANEDGAGFAIARDGRIEIQKGFFTFKEFYSAFREVNNARETAIVHFRFATHGVTNAINCHPFSVCGDKYAMIHNGVIDIECVDKALSDTAHFSELVLQPILEAGVEFDSGALRYLVEEAIGKMNKIVLLRGDGSHVIYNEKQGEWKNGSWYSNGGYKWSGGDWTRYLPSGFGGGHCGAYAPYKSACSGAVDWKEDKHNYGAYSGCEARGVEGYGSEWEYQYDKETNKWNRTAVVKRLNEMTEEEWRKECEEELLQAQAEENEQYAG
jgi:hypothetical protein